MLDIRKASTVIELILNPVHPEEGPSQPEVAQASENDEI
jgi:hypothetical protein